LLVHVLTEIVISGSDELTHNTSEFGWT